MSAQTTKRILIVEDMGNWREALATILPSECEIVLLRTYQEAVAALQSSVFDLAILDVRLEDQNEFNVQGIQLLQLIKECHCDVPVIVLTGYPDQVRPEAIEYYEPDAFLLKVPFDMEEFERVVEKLLWGTSD